MDQNIQKTFIIGDEWIYFKLYTGYKIADVILAETLKPMVERLLVEKIIDQWFFLRYSDPKPHLRIRFHYTSPSNVFDIIQEINTSLKPCFNENLIWKIQLDTYQRELERYGTNTIELAEELFSHDSNMVISMLDLIEGDEGEKIRWLFSIRAIDAYLND
jgi:thiopeptide-type bacteriocin biosynthesis protein